MPVSAALLVSAAGGGEVPPGGGGGGGNFTRGEKTSSSVRLRKRRDDVSQPGRKINRHSGDFSYFAPRKDEIVVRNCVEQTPACHSDHHSEQTSDNPGPGDGNWNYISFPHGIAHVQEVKIGSGSPVVVRMRESPGVNQVKLRTNLNSNRAVSASVMNIQDHHHHHPHHLQHHQSMMTPSSSVAAFRKSGDFSLFTDPQLVQVQSSNYHGEMHQQADDGSNNARRRPHARSHSQQPIKTANLESGRQILHHPPQPQSSNYLHITPSRPGVSVQAKVNQKKDAAMMDKNVAKRCSAEFEFKRINRRSGDFHQLSHVLAQELDKAEEQSFVERMISRELNGDSGSEGSEESGIFSTGSSHESPRKEARKPGLGRRAITQVNMRQEKKNSYNHALAKSQENLVKVCKKRDIYGKHLFNVNFQTFWLTLS